VARGTTRTVSLEEEVVARMDDMLRSYLMMACERLRMHCALARVYPRLPSRPRLRRCSRGSSAR